MKEGRAKRDKVRCQALITADTGVSWRHLCYFLHRPAESGRSGNSNSGNQHYGRAVFGKASRARIRQAIIDSVCKLRDQHYHPFGSGHLLFLWPQCVHYDRRAFRHHSEAGFSGHGTGIDSWHSQWHHLCDAAVLPH